MSPATLGLRLRAEFESRLAGPALRKLERLYDAAASQDPDDNVFAGLLDGLGVRLAVGGEDLARIPKTGPAVVVANHPFGLIEGAVLGALASRVRPDVKIMANSMLRRRPELEDRFIYVDVFGGRRAIESNRSPLRQAIAWLRQGGLLIVFPAGEVSHLMMRRGEIADPRWKTSIGGLIRAGGAAVVPAWFAGHNGFAFQALGLVHPRLRTLQLPAEFLNKREHVIRVRFGKVVPASRAAQLPEERLIENLRVRTYLLGACHARPVLSCRNQALGPEPGPETLAGIVAALPASATLAESGGFQVLLVKAGEPKELIEEVGRVRELVFRPAGEGTGKPVDLDRFDRYYDQLILWHRKDRMVAGGYRIGATTDILPRFGVRGLYTSTLFRYDPRFFERLGPALELGRSFIRPGYQRQFGSLLALWKGIGALVARRPEFRTLFGAVSISNDYLPVSRELIARVLGLRHGDPELGALVKPRRPLRPSRITGLDKTWPEVLASDSDELASVVSELEPDGKSVPVLIRQYLKLGGRLLSFSVDKGFSNTLDGLVLVDLARTDRAQLARYLTEEGAGRFTKSHSLISA